MAFTKQRQKNVVNLKIPLEAPPAAHETLEDDFKYIERNIENESSSSDD
jgi:hypothetical protein